MAKDTAKETTTAVATAPKATTAISTAKNYPIRPREELMEQFPLIANGQEAVDIYRENLGGEAISAFDLTIIKVPSQGMTVWEVPTINGAINPRHIEGIVLGLSRRRSYWADPNPSGTPPDCASSDMEVGIARTPKGPGGECGTKDKPICPFAAFGSARDASGKERRGQACRENKLIALLMPGDNMPVMIKVPPSSLQPVLNFQTKMPVRFTSAIVRFGLTKAKSSDGIEYSEIVPEFVAALPPEEAKLVREFATLISGQLAKAADRAAASADVGE